MANSARPVHAKARTVYVDDDVWDTIQELGWRHRPRESASELTRRALVQYIERETPSKQGGPQ